MKRMIKANQMSAYFSGGNAKVSELLDILEDYMISDKTILDHFLRYLPADTVAEVLEDLIDEIKMDDDEEQQV